MPKIKKKILTDVLYVYLKPANKRYAYKKAEDKGMSYSAYVDQLIEKVRTKEACSSRSQTSLK